MTHATPRRIPHVYIAAELHENLNPLLTTNANVQVATFKVDGIQLAQFEQLLEMWDAHNQAGQ